MKVRLIQPAQLDDQGELIQYEKLPLIVLALPTLAALTPPDVEVSITDESAADVDFNEEVDLVGVSGLTSQAPRAYQIADAFKARGRKTVMGGIHASACPEEALTRFDSVVVGEAEHVWEDVLRDAQANRLKRTYSAEARPDLSRSTVPRFDLLDYDNYYVPPLAKTPILSIQTSRGCCYHCEFCAVQSFLGNSLRTKPIPNVIKELEAYGPKQLHVADDNLAGNLQHAKDFCNAIAPYGIRWGCQLTTTVLDHPELIHLAGKSGCCQALVGIETINKESLSSMRKGFNNPNRYRDLFLRFKDAGIATIATFIFGLDEDTVDSLKYTIDEILSWEIGWAYFNIMTPLPGTKLYGRLEAEGRIVERDWSKYDVNHSVIAPKSITREELACVFWSAYRRFYSASSLVGRAWRFRKQYLVHRDKRSLVQDLLYGFMVRAAVNSGQYPLTIGRKKAAQPHTFAASPVPPGTARSGDAEA